VPVAEEDKGGKGEMGRSVRSSFMKESKVDMPMLFLSRWLLL